MSGLRLGTAYIKVDGDLLETMPGAKLSLGGEDRTPVMNFGVMVGYTFKTEHSELTCTLSLRRGFSLQKLQEIRDATVTFEADTGHRYAMNSAFCSKVISVTAQDGGSIQLVFCGEPAEETSMAADNYLER